MKISAFWRLLRLNLYRNARHLLLSSLGILVGIGSFVFFISLGLGVRTIVANDLLGALPVNQIEIVPKGYNIGMFRLGSTGLLGGSLDEKTVQRLRSLQDVTQVYGKMNLKSPARAVIPIPQVFQQQGMAQAFYTELIVQGLDPKAVDPADLAGVTFDLPKLETPKPPSPPRPLAPPLHTAKTSPSSKPSSQRVVVQPTPSKPSPPSFIRCGGISFPNKPVPVLVSRRLLDLYNSTLAEMRSFPKLNAQAVRAVSFTLVIGSSAFQRTDHPKGVCRLPCRVVGVSNRAILLGISLPLAYVQRLNLIYEGEAAATSYQSVTVEVADTRKLPDVLKTIDQLGFTVDSSQIFARKVGEMILLFALLLTLISAVIMGIAAISISHTFFMTVMERRYQLGLMRAIGATKAVIRWLVLLEAAIVGMVSGLVGLVGAWGITRLLQWGIAQSQRLPFSPDRLFLFPWWLPFAAVGFAIFFCLLGAWLPSRRAAALDPAQVLTEG